MYISIPMNGPPLHVVWSIWSGHTGETFSTEISGTFTENCTPQELLNARLWAIMGAPVHSRQSFKVIWC